MAVAFVFGIVGFFGFGITIHYETHWAGPVTCFGAAYTSLVFLLTCVFGYVLDSYRRHNAEAFVAINARNTLTFALAFIANPWLEQDGPLKVFCTLGAVFVFCSVLAVPLWYVCCADLSGSQRV